jgi:hypothetical protein
MMHFDNIFILQLTEWWQMEMTKLPREYLCVSSLTAEIFELESEFDPESLREWPILNDDDDSIYRTQTVAVRTNLLKVYRYKWF